MRASTADGPKPSMFMASLDAKYARDLESLAGQAVPVQWNITEEDLQKMYAGGVQTYDVTGTAGGMTAHCQVAMIEYNFLQNYSFEDGTEAPWTVTDLAKADELRVEEKSTDSLTGAWHYHFWSVIFRQARTSLRCPSWAETRERPTFTCMQR